MIAGFFSAGGGREGMSQTLQTDKLYRQLKKLKDDECVQINYQPENEEHVSLIMLLLDKITSTERNIPVRMWGYNEAEGTFYYYLRLLKPGQPVPNLETMKKIKFELEFPKPLE